MGGQLLSSKIVVVEEEPRVRGIPSAPTAVIGAIGITERGPIGEATLVTSFEAFQTKFGGFTADSDLALAAMGFFENGGRQLWVVRTVHHTDIADPATATAVRGFGYLVSPGTPTPASITGAVPGPFRLTAGDVIVLSVNGGADETATFNAVAAQGAARGSSPFALADGQTLTLRIDGGLEQTVTFRTAEFGDIARATPAEVAAVVNAAIDGGKALVLGGVLTLASDTEGTGSSVEVTGGTASAALAFSAGVVFGTGDVADISAVTSAEVKAVVEAAITGVIVDVAVGSVLELRTTATGSATSLQARVTTAAAFGFGTDPHAGSNSGSAHSVRVEGKDPGGYANRVEVEVQ